MAPIKLEDNMKERLEERTIEPTMTAWERISSKLDEAEEVRKSKRILWMSIAASFVGGTLVALFLFQNMNSDTTPVLVNTNESPLFIDPTEEIQLLDIKKEGILKEVKDAITIEEQSVESEKPVTQLVENTQKTSLEKKEKIAQVTQQNTNVSKPSIGNRPEKDKNILIVKTRHKEGEGDVVIKDEEAFAKAITEKTDEVIAKVENSDVAINAEIEALLKNAQRDIISTQTFNQKTNTIDANALLLDVEAEVAPTSFRNKIFEKVVKGFEITKDAVVNRNN